MGGTVGGNDEHVANTLRLIKYIIIYNSLITMAKPGNINALGKGGPASAAYRLKRSVIEALMIEFTQHGRATLIKLRESSPAQFMQLIAQLVPKEQEVTVNRIDALSDDDIDAAIDDLQERLARAKVIEAERIDSAVEQLDSVVSYAVDHIEQQRKLPERLLAKRGRYEAKRKLVDPKTGKPL